MKLNWVRQPTTRHLAREMRASTRATRPQIGSHWFSYGDLAELWHASGHAVLTHHHDQVWQHWRNNYQWRLIGIHPDRSAAWKAAAEYTPPMPATGIYLVTRAGIRDDEYVIRVRLCSERSPLPDIFARMGYATTTERVG